MGNAFETWRKQMEERFAPFYEKHFAQLAEALEIRRKRYLRLFYIRMTVVIALILTSFLYMPHLRNWLHSASGKAEAEHSFADTIGYVLIWEIWVIMLLIFGLFPLVRYRRYIRYKGGRLHDEMVELQNLPDVEEGDDEGRRINLLYVLFTPLRLIFNVLPGTSGGISDRLSYKKVRLKELIYSRVFKAFGPFTFRPEGMNAEVNLMHPLLLPPHDEYRSEDYIRGIYEQTILNIGDAQLVSKIQEKRRSIFRGLFVTIDLSDPKVRLRGLFQGRTAVIERKRRKLSYIKERFKHFEEIDLPKRKLNEHFKAFTTHQAEAQEVLSDAFFTHLLRLGKVLEQAPKARKNWDDAIYRLLTSASRPKLYDVDEESALSDALYSINNAVQCSFYEDKIQITIPYQEDLFEPPSLFARPLEREELFTIFCLMHVLSDLIKEVDRAKSVLDQPYPELDS